MLQSVRITSKRQITIPVKIFAEMGITKGDRLIVEKKGPSIILTSAEILVNQLAGIIKVLKPLKDQTLEKIISQSKIKYFQNKYKK